MKTARELLRAVFVDGIALLPELGIGPGSGVGVSSQSCATAFCASRIPAPSGIQCRSGSGIDAGGTECNCASAYTIGQGAAALGGCERLPSPAAASRGDCDVRFVNAANIRRAA